MLSLPSAGGRLHLSLVRSTIPWTNGFPSRIVSSQPRETLALASWGQWGFPAGRAGLDIGGGVGGATG
ncbi:hypothetical protein Pmani_024171 [Petrolisthes manimaculis]|uniref:Uncharacterized protein n=1 Tax=Petrolisthes manimaculis TaxID=1843537 RepID=A0AAE1PAR3_9EUCA|nr:hypothetical protein Pmani_024171 [Petrolisthes manimaculis]